MSFLAVLGLTSTLVLMLFDEARAVSIEGSGPNSVLRTADEVDLVFTIDIPEDQLLPVESLALTLEKTSGSSYEDPTEVAMGSCDGAGGCDPVEETDGAEADSLLRIEADGENPSEEFGYLTITHGDDTLIADDAFTSGYGYGYGYGYGGSTGGQLVYTVVLAPEQLTTGHYWVTFTVATGSTTIGAIASEPKHIEIESPSSDDGGSSTPTPPIVVPTTIPPTPPTLPPNSGSPPIDIPREETPDGGVRGEVELPPQADDTAQVAVDLSTLDDGLGVLRLTTGASDAPVKLSVEVSRTPPASHRDLPNGFRAGNLYLEINVEGGAGSGATGAIEFFLDDEDLAGQAPGLVTLLHFKDGSWVTETTFYKGVVNGRHAFESTVTGLSPFAVTLDVAAPVIGALSPAADATANVRATIGALVTDNRALDITRTALYIDGQLVPALLTQVGVFYTPAVPLTAGAHTARLVATDIGGQQSEKSWVFTASQDTPLPPTNQPTQPTQQPTPPPTSATPTPPPTSEEKGGIPGFELVALLAALAVALLVLRRKQ